MVLAECLGLALSETQSLGLILYSLAVCRLRMLTNMGGEVVGNHVLRGAKPVDSFFKLENVADWLRRESVSG